MAREIVPVILCGGAGSRLWPVSRQLLPKQFLPLVTGRTLLQDTALRARVAQDTSPRARDAVGDQRMIVICNEAHRFLVNDQLAEIGITARVLLEPAGRNTAAAVAVAAIACEAENPILLVLASDHAIRGADAFNGAVRRAAEVAASDMLVTFGIAATRPDSGFGYVESGDPLPGNAGAFKVARFVEKPSEDQARAMIATGRVYWNSGMFAFGARRVLEELGRFRPDILEAARAAVAAATDDLGFLRLGKEAFLACPAEAIDRAVMEHTAHAAVIPADFAWSDVGSWSALWDLAEKDASGNAARGDVQLQDTRDSLVFGAERLIATLGVDGLIIVDTEDALLVADRSRSQEVREVVEDLKRANRSEHLSHRRVYRPWGYFESVDSGERYQVKRLMVKPGHSLSLQLHRKRAEHWVVVSGRALVTRGEDILYLEENQSTFIPVGTKHRLENAGEKPLLIIEVQSGSYLGEDDIERFEDRYNRA
ncbi:MAG: mannose-1-phosphate guanylyltransferase/mannose-6-phosphate isomerase [Betaproteobacteria bacterium]|nr:mannose-1-phosphate guanylyltransferase/mannose-6-phosphate isomerase [Betaproteobacteria bacterium]